METEVHFHTLLKTFIYTRKICIDAYAAGRMLAILRSDRKIMGFREERRERRLFRGRGEKELRHIQDGW